MKKLFLVIALVAAYGITISNASVKVLSSEKPDVTIVADSGDNSIVSLNKDEDPPAKKTATAKKDAPAKACCPAAKAEAGAKAEKAVGCSEAQVKSCAASKTTCAEEKK